MTVERVNVHGWPGRGDASKLKASSPAPRAERFGERPGIVLVAAAERYRVPESWGLGVALSVSGSTISSAALIVRDDIALDTLDALRTWAKATAISTPSGLRPVRLTTRTRWTAPEGSGLIGAYTGGRWLVTADEGRSLGLLADHWAPAVGVRFREGFTLGLHGWGQQGTWVTGKGNKKSGWQARLHEPTLRVKALGPHGINAQFGRAGRKGRTQEGAEAGHWEGRRGHRKPFGGRIVDLIGVAHAFDGLDTSDLGDHLGAFGLAPIDVPAAVPLTPDAAQALLDAALGVHQLALALDTEAARWLTTPHDLRDGVARVTIRRIYSAGGLASALLNRSGVTPPLAKFSTPDDLDLDRWSGASHGGWCTATLTGQVLPVADADVRQAYPTAWVLLDAWRVLTARQLRRVDVTADVRRLCEAAAVGDFSALYDRATYGSFGLTLCDVLPDGEPWPVERPTKRGPRFDVAPLRSPVPLPFAWPDVILAAALSGKVPTIVSATRLFPVGTEDNLRPVPLRDGVVVPAGEDPIPALVRMRPDRGMGEDRLRDLIRGVANPLAWGVFARLDQYRVRGELRERVARWSWPPIAASIPSVARLWLAVIERQVRDLGGAVVSRDTDGIALVASPEAGEVRLRDGGVVHALSWGEVDGLVRPFDGMDVFGDGKAAWGVDREHEGQPLHMLALAPKRYVLGVESQGGGYAAVGGTEHSLGGGVADPPDMRGRDAARRHVWTVPIAQRALDLASGHALEDWVSPWDQHGAEAFPVLRRFSVGSPSALAGLPPELQCRPFTPMVEGQLDRLHLAVGEDRPAPVALDPGTGLGDWDGLDWRNTEGGPIRIGVRPGRRTNTVLRSLSVWALAWCRPVPSEPVGLVEVDPHLIRRVGRGGALIDALLADPTARPDDHQVVYTEADGAAFVADIVARMGRRPFAATFGLPLRSVHDIARGGRADGAAVRRVLEAVGSGAVAPTSCGACGAPVWRRGATYCSERCRRTAEGRRRRSAVEVTVQPCRVPGCTRPARSRSRTCSEAHKKALGRQPGTGGAS